MAARHVGGVPQRRAAVGGPPFVGGAKRSGAGEALTALGAPCAPVGDRKVGRIRLYSNL
jgi:hypothetical protein